MNLLSSVVFTITLSPLAAADTPMPNIVFILADDVGCEPIGCYGGQSFATPHIDRLANTGMRFRHCYSMPVCHPTRTTFLTGKYPRRIGTPRWGTFPPALEGRTVAHSLRRAGYATAVAGKWQLALLGNDLQHPHRLGFAEYCLFGWHEGGRYHDPLIWQNGAQRPDTKGEYGPDLYVDFLIDFIRRHRDQPFFVFYSMALCHDVTDDLVRPVAYAPGMDRYETYGEMVAAMDRCVGRLVETLNRLDLRDRTLIVFTGDNGTAKRSILRAVKSDDEWEYVREPVVCERNGVRVPGGKGNLTNDGTNVPLICNWRGQVRGGRVVDDLVDFSDFYSTFLELGHVERSALAGVDGRSFARRLLRDEAAPRTWAYSEQGRRRWVRTQRWKLYNDGGLFDLETDPHEERDLRESVPKASASEGIRMLRDALRSL